MGLSRLFKWRPRIGFAEHGHQVYEFDLPEDGKVSYAQWLHPFETKKEVTQESVNALRQFIEPGDFVIDIGAHTGDTTIPMALAAGPTGLTLALEPNPHVYKVLDENAGLNSGKVNIDPQCWAATEDDGQFVFHYTDASFVNGGFKTQQKWPLFRRQHPLTVEGRNLENVLHEEYSDWLHKLTYVKVDAEGYDGKILQSIRNVLEDTRPVVRTEVFRKLVASERHELFDLLADVDYEIYHYEEAEEIQGRRLERDDMNRERHFDILAVPTGRVLRAAA